MRIRQHRGYTVEEIMNASSTAVNENYKQEIASAKSLSEYSKYGQKENPVTSSALEKVESPNIPSASIVAKLNRLYTYKHIDAFKDSYEIAKQTGISPEAYQRADRETKEKMIVFANAVKDGKNVEALWKNHPEIRDIKAKSVEAQVLAFKNAEQINETLDIVGSVSSGVKKNELEREHGYLTYDLMDESKTEEEKRELEAKILENEKQQAMLDEKQNFFNEGIEGATKVFLDLVKDGFKHPELIATGVVSQAISNAALGGGVGSVVPGVGTFGGAALGGGRGILKGAASGVAASMAEEVHKRSAGEKSWELKKREAEDGTRLYTDEEANRRGFLYGATDAVLEVAPEFITLGPTGKVVAKTVGKLASKMADIYGKQTGQYLKKVVIGSTGELSSTALSKLGGYTIPTYRRVGTETVKMVARNTGVETGAEVLQTWNDNIQDNLFGKKGDVRYSSRDIANNSIDTVKDVFATTFTVGVLSSVAPGVSAFRAKRRFDNLSPYEKNLVASQAMSDKGASVLSGIAEDVKENAIAQYDPAWYGEIVQKAADYNGMSEIYINPQELHEIEGGTEVLQELEKVGLLTHDDIVLATTNGTSLKVPLGKYAQLSGELSPETIGALQQTTHYYEGGLSAYGVKSEIEAIKNVTKTPNKDVIAEKRTRNEQFIEEHMNELSPEVREVMHEHLGSDKETVLKDIVKSMGEVEQEVIALVGKNAYKRAKKIGGEQNVSPLEVLLQMEINEARDNSVVTEDGKELVGDKKGIARVQLLKSLVDDLNNKGRAIEEIQKVDADEFLLAGMSKEAVEVYNLVKNELSTRPGMDKKMVSANALIYASHADRMATILKGAGKSGYTALDYYKAHGVEANAKEDGTHGYYQEETTSQEETTAQEENNPDTEEETKEEVPAYEEKIVRDEEEFSKAIDEFWGLIQEKINEKKEELKKQNKELTEDVEPKDVDLTPEESKITIRVMDLPLIIDMMERKVEDSRVENRASDARPEVQVSYPTLYKILCNKHGDQVNHENIKELIRGLIDPWMVAKNHSYGNDAPGFAIVTGVLRDGETTYRTGDRVNNIQTVVRFSFDNKKVKRGDKEVDVYDLVTAFARDLDPNYKGKTEKKPDQWYKTVIKGGNVLYVNEDVIGEIYPELKKYNKKSTATNSSDNQVRLELSQYFNASVALKEDLVKEREKFNNLYYQGVNGASYFYDGNESLIKLFKSANASTFIHEAGHVFLEDWKMLAQMENAPEWLVNDWKTIVDETGYRADGTFEENRDAHEKFAKMFEVWVREGKAPNEMLKGAFHSFRKWLCKIYKTIKHLGVRPSKDLQAVMGRMVATQESIDAWAAEQTYNASEYEELFKSVPEGQQEEVRKQLEAMKDNVYEAVRNRFADEFNGNQKKLWRTERSKAKELIEEQLAADYPCYNIRRLYETVGESIFLVSEYKSLEELQEAEQRALGDFKTVVKQQLDVAREEFLKSDITREEVYAIADKWMQTNEGRAKLIEAELVELRTLANQSVSDTYTRLTLLNELDLESEHIDEQIKYIMETNVEELRNDIREESNQEKPKDKHQEKIDKLTAAHKEKVAELKEKHKEKIESLKAKNAEKIDEVKQKLKERIVMARQLRDAKLGKFKDRLAEQYAMVKGVSIGQVRRYKSYNNKITSVGRKTERALARGDINEAIRYKHEQFNAVAMARVSYELNLLINATVRKWRVMNKAINKVSSSQKLDPDACYFVQHVLYNLGVVAKDGIEPVDGFNIERVKQILYPEEVMENLERTKENMDKESRGDVYEGEVLSSIPPEVMKAFEMKRPLTELTVEEFEVVSATLKTLHIYGRHVYKANTLLSKDGKKMGIDKAAEEMVANSPLQKSVGSPLSEKFGRTTAQKMSEVIGDITLDLIRTDNILIRLDGGEKGAFYQYVFLPIDRATNKAMMARAELGKRYEALFSDYSKDELHTMRNKREFVVGQVEHCTMENVVCMALNLGTLNNRQRLVETLGAPIEQIEAEINAIIGDKEVKLIQGIWKMYDEHFAARAEVEERLNGQAIKKEEGIKINLKGKTIQGMYYPIQYDFDVDLSASHMQNKQALEAQMTGNSAYGRHMGSMKKRKTNVKGRLLALDFDVMITTMDDAIQHIYVREAVIDVRNLLAHKDVKEHIIRTLGMKTYVHLQNWVRDCWCSESQRTGRLELIWDRIRRNTTFAVIAYNTATSALNATNFMPMVNALGTVNAMQAVRQYYGSNPMAKRDVIIKKSAMMANRAQTLDKDLKRFMDVDGEGVTYTTETGEKISKAVEKVKDTKETINEFGYTLISETDLLLALPMWQYTYDRSIARQMAEGYVDAEIMDLNAISEADAAVKEVFGDGSLKNQVGFQRRKSYLTYFTGFYTYSGTMLNVLLRDAYIYKDTGNIKPLIRTVFYNVMLVAIMEELIRHAIKSLCGDDAEGIEDIPKASLKRMIENASQGYPLIRDLISYTASKALGERTYGRGGNAPILSVIGEFGNVVNDLKSDKKDWLDVGRDISRVGNRLFGFSDAITDGFWAALVLASDKSEKDFAEALASILFKKRVR